MANRNTLHRSKLDGFKRWLEQDGWDLQPAKGDYEVLRARKGRRLLLVYDRHEGNHLSVADANMGVVRSYLRDKEAEHELA
ncbi:hypothetical protein [Paenibacillus pinihumi]|uniref:hypothetical protein n=1 Tax=Paenibacillus pinihumi TaxID=669462 RepID=UPI00040F2E78|nr:hypothetical protein [Paenibacillus pinihumi]